MSVTAQMLADAVTSTHDSDEYFEDINSPRYIMDGCFDLGRVANKLNEALGLPVVAEET